MIRVTKKYADVLVSWKKAYVPLACFLCKYFTKKHFVLLKTNAMMGRKTTLSFRLSSIYYLLGCEMHICKKCYMSNRLKFMGSIYNPCKDLVCVNLSYLLKQSIIKYGVYSFYNRRGSFLNKTYLT